MHFWGPCSRIRGVMNSWLLFLYLTWHDMNQHTILVKIAYLCIRRKWFFQILNFRLSTSGSSGLSHTTGAVTGQARPSSYPDAVLLFGSFTPRKFDANRVKFPVMGVYKKYTQKNIATRFTDDHPVYKHESEPLFLAYYSMNKSWRITSKDNIAKVGVSDWRKTSIISTRSKSSKSHWDFRTPPSASSKPITECFMIRQISQLGSPESALWATR